MKALVKLSPGVAKRRYQALIDCHLDVKQALAQLRKHLDLVDAATLHVWVGRRAKELGYDKNQLFVHLVLQMPVAERSKLFRQATDSMQILQGLELHEVNAYLYVYALVDNGLKIRGVNNAAKRLGLSERTLERSHRDIARKLGTTDKAVWLRLLCSLYLYAREHPEVLEEPVEPDSPAELRSAA